jgi:hypothetical protein
MEVRHGLNIGECPGLISQIWEGGPGAQALHRNGQTGSLVPRRHGVFKDIACDEGTSPFWRGKEKFAVGRPWQRAVSLKPQGPAAGYLDACQHRPASRQDSSSRAGCLSHDALNETEKQRVLVERELYQALVSGGLGVFLKPQVDAAGKQVESYASCSYPVRLRALAAKICAASPG